MIPGIHDKKKGLGQIIASRMVGDEPAEQEYGPEDDLKAYAQDFIDAVKSGDAEALASAFEAMFKALESEPHEEGSAESE